MRDFLYYKTVEYYRLIPYRNKASRTSRKHADASSSAQNKKPQMRFFVLCRGAGSNRRPHPLQGYALPTELPRQATPILAKKYDHFKGKFWSANYCPFGTIKPLTS